MKYSEIVGLHPPTIHARYGPAPPPVANIYGENVLGALFILKVPGSKPRPPNFLMLPTPLHAETYTRLGTVPQRVKSLEAAGMASQLAHNTII
jgi:hypothetical protein